MIVHSTNVSQPQEIKYRGELHQTGIFKRPITGPLQVSASGIAADVTCDLVNHGGAHKAVYGFSLDHYPHWRDRLANPELGPGAFGENLTVSGLDEQALCIGDQLEIGSAVLEVSQPRVPCFKLGIALGDERAPAMFTRHFHTGVYFRVSQGGEISAGDNATVIHRHAAAISVYQLFRAYHDRDFAPGADILQAAAELPELAPEWREKAMRRCQSTT